MKTLMIEGVRAFRDRVHVPLRKLTLLVGENSTGKSTVLACTRIAWDIVNTPEVPVDLNEDPFELGTYDSIAHYHGGPDERVTQFSIGAEVDTRTTHWVDDREASRALPPSTTRAIESTFVSEKGAPVVQSWSSTHGALELFVERLTGGQVRARMRHGDRTDEVIVDVPAGSTLPQALHFVSQVDRRESLALWNKALRETWAIDYSMRGDARPVAFAPVRSRPRRTYDRIHQRLDAQGQHAPAVLSRLHREDGAEWTRVVAALEEFGTKSGLFDTLSLRILGNEGDPFQLELEVSGQKGRRNLLDVGYGVSQVLPILVECALDRNGGMLLLQQPEVHLHPRAQAELGTLLATLTAGPEGPQCVVETHSDYLVDRVAMAVRDPNHPLGPDDVSLLFFSPNGADVTIHPLRFGANGDVIDPPPEYRSFFLHEHARYLGLDEGNA